jgi:hypothetical protein
MTTGRAFSQPSPKGEVMKTHNRQSRRAAKKKPQSKTLLKSHYRFSVFIDEAVKMLINVQPE